ncbi:MAG: phospho-sugar mutase, partial [Micrococcales bacterium]|nr:phospho-sugar mutase [Micrococcales bacterium]
MAGDVDPSSVEELAGLVAAARRENDTAELADRFSGPLTFGTAGLRGPMGAGESRMNRAVVIRTAAGLMSWLWRTLSAPPFVVIGFDARRGSREFALDTAAVVTAAGGRALLLGEPTPTPVLAFAVRSCRADAGVMVTASHNPAADNGYKVYLGGRVATGSADGVQILPPTADEIAAHIAAAPRAGDIPRAPTGWTTDQGEIPAAYLAAIVRRGATDPGADGVRRDVSAEPRTASGRDWTGAPGAAAARSGANVPTDLRIVYTAMHGVGAELMLAALEAAGFTAVHVVEEQREPDATFPTVSAPNPEEPGALDRALDLAKRVNADLVLAHDPDADRCAVAVFDPKAGETGTAGEWRALHGDELGVLLGEAIAQACTQGKGATLACSLVSSTLLEKIAA